MPNSAEAVARGLVKKIMPYGWDDGGETKPLLISEITVALTAYAAQQVQEGKVEQWKKHICHFHKLPNGEPQPTCACLLCLYDAKRQAWEEAATLG